MSTAEPILATKWICIWIAISVTSPVHLFLFRPRSVASRIVFAPFRDKFAADMFCPGDLRQNMTLPRKLVYLPQPFAVLSPSSGCGMTGTYG